MDDYAKCFAIATSKFICVTYEWPRLPSIVFTLRSRNLFAQDQTYGDTKRARGRRGEEHKEQRV